MLLGLKKEDSHQLNDTVWRNLLKLPVWKNGFVLSRFLLDLKILPMLIFLYGDIEAEAPIQEINTFQDIL